MAEIDTAAPFASVRDAIYMFGEQSSDKIQRAFATTHDPRAEKIQSLELELHQLREEYLNVKNLLLIANITSTNTIEKLEKLELGLKEKTQIESNSNSSENSSLEVKNNTIAEKNKQNLHELECSKEELKSLHEKLSSLGDQHQLTLSALSKVQEENQNLKDESDRIINELKKTAEEQEEISTKRIKDLLQELNVTKEMLACITASYTHIEEDLKKQKISNMEREINETFNTTCEIEKMKSELLSAEKKQEEITWMVGELKEKLIAAKEGERIALQREHDATLALKQMTIDIEDSRMAKEEVKMLVIHLEDMNSQLKDIAQEENVLLEYLASLKFELKNTKKELDNYKTEAKETTMEMKDYIDQLQLSLSVAMMEEAKAKECLSNLNEALQQVTVESIEAKATTTQAIEEVVVKTQELEEAIFHNKTLECQLTAATKEIEASKASEVFAYTEIKFLKQKIDSCIDSDVNGEEVTISYDEYKTMTKRITDSEDLAKKRIVAALAQVDASKASELEISRKLASVKNLLERSQMAMKQAVQVAQNAEAAKFSLERELQKWRSENEQRRKAAIAAVMAVGNGNNCVLKSCSPLPIDHTQYDEKSILANESYSKPITNSLNSIKPKQTLAHLLRYNISGDEKTTKKLFCQKLSSYFNKRIK